MEGAYGALWGEIEKSDCFGVPSIVDVVMGIYNYHIQQVDMQFEEMLMNDYS